MKKILLLAFFSIFQLPAYANSQIGFIENLNVTSSESGSNHTHVKLSGDWSNKPACTKAGTWWTFNSDSEKGKNFLSVLLAAQMAGKEVTIWGGSLDCHNEMAQVVQIGLTK